MHKPSNTLQQVKEWLEKCSRFPFETMKKWDALYYIQQLESRLAQVERERDAAVAEIKRMEDKAKELLETEIHDAILRELPYSDYMDFINQVEQICNYQFEDEWRGVREVNTKEE